MAQQESTTFESAVERLEHIVEEMEGDQLPLEEMLQRYEEGTKLVKLCGEKLTAAEKRIEIVARNASGKPQIDPFDPAAPTPPPRSTKGSPKSATSADVSLF